MDDDQLDEPLRSAARDYHAAPEPPREAMWRAIEAQRRVDRVRRPAARRWTAWAMAAAAVLTVGIGIGRVTVPDAPAGPTPGNPVAAAAPAPRVNETAYRLTTVEHLSQSEAFLTLFRASVRSGTHEQLASATARQLLATNRLLLDSPAAENRRTRLLLEDLELVLAEIAQLSPGASADDRKLIREGMERGGVLTRLRTVVPAGTTSTRGDL
ncbi:MAG TPA: hypothetical protein VMY76_16470 [Gemmatimonadales bacterium]|nr:hypothetical protein [Gemmatimonadales bacterium]